MWRLRRSKGDEIMNIKDPVLREKCAAVSAAFARRKFFREHPIRFLRCEFWYWKNKMGRYAR